MLFGPYCSPPAIMSRFWWRSCHSLDGLADIFGAQWLDQIFPESSLQRRLATPVVGMCGNNDALGGRAYFPGLFQESQTVPIRQFDVAQKYIEIIFFAGALGLGIRVSNCHAMTVRLEHAGEDRGRIGVVFDQEDVFCARTHHL